MIQGRVVSRLLLYGALVSATAVLALPFFWMVVTSLKPTAELALDPPTLWPSTLALENYRTAWNAAPFGRYFVNSLLTGAVAASLQVGFALLMAYAFVFVRVPGKPILFVAVLATMMIPDEMKLIPNYLLLSKLGWLDTYKALIIPPAAHAFPVFVLYQHMRTVPKPLVEAAKMDGAGHLHILFRVIVPISRPVVAAVALIAFLGRWNDYLWPLVVTNREAMRTLPVGLAYLHASQEGGLQWNILMAGAIFVIIPILFLFLLTQRQFVEGITQGSFKG